MSVPKLAPGVRLSFDGKRDQWLVQAPERVIILDSIGAAVLALVDGITDTAEIITRLADDYDAPEDEIAADVIALLDDLAGRGLLALK